MKKLMIATAMFVMASSLGLSAQERKNCPAAPGCTTAAQCGPREGCRPDIMCAFEGLNLTDAQKEQIKGLCQKRQGDRAAKAQAKRESKARAKAERRAAREQERKEYLAMLKGILTPEQYVQFLENSYAKGSFKGPKRQGKKGHRKGVRTVCPQAPACPAQK